MKKTEADGLKMFVPQQVALDAIVLAPYNPRVMSPNMMAALKASIVKHGVVLNLVVQRRSSKYAGDNVLIGGHQRLDAVRAVCKERGWVAPTHASAVILDCTDAEAMQLNAALNNIEGDFDPYKLGEMFSAIRSDMTLEDVLATGFNAEQIDQMIKLSAPVEEQVADLERDIADGVGSFAGSITLSVEFDTAERRDAVKADLLAWARERGVKPGVLLADAVSAARVAGKKRKRAAA